MTILGKKQTEFQSRFSAAKELEATTERNKEVIEEEKLEQVHNLLESFIPLHRLSSSTQRIVFKCS